MVIAWTEKWEWYIEKYWWAWKQTYEFIRWHPRVVTTGPRIRAFYNYYEVTYQINECRKSKICQVSISLWNTCIPNAQFRTLYWPKQYHYDHCSVIDLSLSWEYWVYILSVLVFTYIICWAVNWYTIWTTCISTWYVVYF